MRIGKCLWLQVGFTHIVYLVTCMVFNRILQLERAGARGFCMIENLPHWILKQTIRVVCSHEFPYYLRKWNAVPGLCYSAISPGNIRILCNHRLVLLEQDVSC